MTTTRTRLAPKREKKIMRLLVQGHTNAEISRRTDADATTVARRRERLGIGPATIVRRATRRHPREEEILAALRAGGSNNGIRQQLGVDKVAVARIRRENGIPDVMNQPHPEPPSLHEQWRQHAKELDGGHITWTGSRATGSGTPLLRDRGTWYSAAGIAFEIRTGRTPTGQVKAECDVKQCVAPACVEDEPGRQNLRLQLRRLKGLPDPPTGKCPNGHALAVDGRLDGGLAPYCEGCKRDTRRALRQATKTT
ncbi:hypothetical protein [Streptomyces sp. 049-1]|uniref:hypothetical protein n=1 Tax=Streptomyces sp. 049-1 TaxID=2789264 RepID=UPI0039802B41